MKGLRTIALTLLLLAGALLAQVGEPEQTESKESIEQLLARCIVIQVAKIQPGVIRDQNHQAVYRTATIEGTAFKRRGLNWMDIESWYAPMEDLGTDDYCVMIWVISQADTWTRPPGSKLSKDLDDNHQLPLSGVQEVREVALTKRIIHSTEKYPNLSQAMRDGYISVDGRKYTLIELVRLARKGAPKSNSGSSKKQSESQLTPDHKEHDDLD